MMKYIILSFALLFACSISSCTNNASNHANHDHSGHDHSEHSSSHVEDESDHEEHNPIENHAHSKTNITHFQEGYEVFIEMGEWLVNEKTELDIKITRLNDYSPLAIDGIGLTVKGSNTDSFKAHSHGVGTYHSSYTPTSAGKSKLRIAFKDNNGLVYININEIITYNDHDDLPKGTTEDPGLIHFIKKTAWIENFRIDQINYQETPRLIKTSGKIMPAPGDEFIITALHAGTINLNKQLVEGKKIYSGDVISTISSSSVHENITNKYLRAKNEYEKAKLDYNRAKNLIDEKLISEKEFLEAKLNFDSSKNNFENINRYYNDGNQQLKSPTDGYIRSLFVKEGQYIEEGQPIATIIRNKRILLKANMPQQYNHLASSIFDANFSPVYSNKIFNIKDLNGERLSYSSALPDNSQFVPLYFEIDANQDIMPGSYAEIYLKSASFNNSLTIPTEALMEDQGNYFVYVLANGEHYRKTFITIGDSDGFRVAVVSGLYAKDWVVTKGAYQVYLASLGSSAPAHAHAH